MYISNQSSIVSDSVYNYTLSSLTIQQQSNEIANVERVLLLVLISLTIIIRILMHIRQLFMSPSKYNVILIFVFCFISISIFLLFYFLSQNIIKYTLYTIQLFLPDSYTSTVHGVSLSHCSGILNSTSN